MADHDASDGEEGLVDVVSAFVANSQPPELVKPCDRALHHPAVDAETSVLGKTKRASKTCSCTAITDAIGSCGISSQTGSEPPWCWAAAIGAHARLTHAAAQPHHRLVLKARREKTLRCEGMGWA